MRLKIASIIAIIGKCVLLLWELWLIRNPADKDVSSWIYLFDTACMSIFFFVLYLKVRGGESRE